MPTPITTRGASALAALALAAGALAPAALAQQDLRTPDTHDAAQGYRPALPPPEPGFDWVPVALGGAAASGLIMVAAAFAGRDRRGLSRRSDAASAPARASRRDA